MNTLYFQAVGYPKKDKNILNIGSGCGTAKKILHEVLELTVFFSNAAEFLQPTYSPTPLHRLGSNKQRLR